MKVPCILCNCKTREFETIGDRQYLQCTGCKAILLSPKNYLTPQAEKFRYSLHNNDIDDPGYIFFVSPIIERIKSQHKIDEMGLDFGCGPGPVIASELEKAGYQVNLYDPYFNPNKAVLNREYDFIFCCEVMEHFQEPVREFKLLRSLLKNKGKLYCKTTIWKQDIDFQNWHYKNDLTHVIFYNRESLEWIANNLNFSKVEILDKFIVFTA